MTFLSKLGKIIVTGLQILTGLQPIIAAGNPGAGEVALTVENDLSKALKIIVSMEAVGAALGLSGADKLRAAAPQIMQVLLGSADLVGKPIANPALALKGASSVASGLADFLNAIHPDAATATTVVTANPIGVNPAAVTA